MRRLFFGLFAAVLIGGMVLSSCSTPAPAPAPTPTPTPAPKPSPAPSPTPTPASTSTPSPKPTASPTPTPTPASSGIDKNFVPKTLSVASHEIASSGFQGITNALNVIAKKYNIRVRTTPASGDTGRLLLLRGGQAELMSGGTEAYTVSQALFNYGDFEWGPVPLQAVWLPMRQDGMAAAVRGDSDIKTMADLKGKKVPWPLGFEINTGVLYPGIMAFGGVTWKDVTKVEMSGSAAAMKGLIDGKVDVAFMGTIAPGMYEVEASPHGIRWLPMPASDTEAWKRVWAIAPVLTPATISVGAGISKDKPVQLASTVYPMTIVMDKLPDNMAYFLAKAIHSTYDEYYKANPDVMVGWQIDTCLSDLQGTPIPFHNGAVQYFKDIGKWTPALEKLNQERAAQNLKVLKAWTTARDEALDKGIAASKFAAYWESRRAALMK